MYLVCFAYYSSVAVQRNDFRIFFALPSNFVGKIMTALEASWVLNHATLASYKLVSYEIDCNILYAICNEETDLWNIVLIRKWQKRSVS